MHIRLMETSAAETLPSLLASSSEWPVHVCVCRGGSAHVSLDSMPFAVVQWGSSVVLQTLGAYACKNAITILFFCARSPENMLHEVRRWPASKTLEDLKDCLDFCNTSWIALFCQLGGAELLLQVRACLSILPEDLCFNPVSLCARTCFD